MEQCLVVRWFGSAAASEGSAASSLQLRGLGLLANTLHDMVAGCAAACMFLLLVL